MGHAKLREINQKTTTTTYHVERRGNNISRYSWNYENATCAQSGRDYASQKRNASGDTSGLRDSNGKFYRGAKNKLRIATEYVRKWIL